jgi:hypothetical protein
LFGLASSHLLLLSVTGGSRGKIYFDLEPDLGESEILGYAVGPRWRIGSSNFFASVETIRRWWFRKMSIKLFRGFYVDPLRAEGN